MEICMGTAFFPSLVDNAYLRNGIAQPAQPQ
jgi:hypothetical protein